MYPLEHIISTLWPIHPQRPHYILKRHLNGFLPHFQLRARDSMTQYVSWMDGPLAYFAFMGGFWAAVPEGPMTYDST